MTDRAYLIHGIRTDGEDLLYVDVETDTLRAIITTTVDGVTYVIPYSNIKYIKRLP